MLCGSAFKNKGVQPMLDAVVDFLPSPIDIPPTEGIDLKGEPVERKASENEPFSALAFKIVADPYGKLTYFRIYSGKLEKGSEIYNSTKDRKERIGRILRMHANQREDIDVAYAGDIVAGLGFKQTTTGDTLCERAHPIILEQMEFPEPVISVAIEPKTKADQDKLGKALGSLSDEDPTFQVHTDEDTGQTIIARHGRAAPRGARRPDDARVQRRSARRQAAGRVPRDDHAAGREGRGPLRPPDRWPRPVRARRASPSSRPAPAAATSSSTRSRAASSPASTSPRSTPVSKRRCRAACVAGYPLVDVRARLTYGSYHEVDSSEMAFKIAGSMALKEAARKAKPQLLEPVMAVEVVTAEDYMGDVIGDLNSRRGQVEGMEQRGNAQVITAKSAVGADVRVCWRPSVSHPRARDLHDAVRLVPSSAGLDRAGDHRPRPRRVTPRPYSLVTRHVPNREVEVVPWPKRSSSARSRT